MEGMARGFWAESWLRTWGTTTAQAATAYRSISVPRCKITRPVPFQPDVLMTSVSSCQLFVLEPGGILMIFIQGLEHGQTFSSSGNPTNRGRVLFILDLPPPDCQPPALPVIWSSLRNQPTEDAQNQCPVRGRMAHTTISSWRSSYVVSVQTTWCW